jgi:hypothetical protein
MRLRRTLPWLLPPLLTACGREGAPSAAVSDVPAATQGKKGEREEIPSTDEALQRAQALLQRDAPLQVGATAPSFAGYPEKARVVIVFFRGEW